MNEMRLLEITLWVFFVSFALKSIVFGVLAKTMAKPWPPEPGLGRALFFHYVTISVQAVVLSAIYFYYASRFRGLNIFEPTTRSALYVLGIASVISVVVSGTGLLVTYFKTGERQKIQKDRQAQQDARGIRQDARGGRQDRRETRQDNRENRLDIRDEEST